MELLSKGGRARGTVMSSTRTQPWASRSCSSIGSSGWILESTSSRCSATDQTRSWWRVWSVVPFNVLHLLGDVAAKPGPEVRAQVFTFACQSDNGTQVVATVSGVIAPALEDDAVDGTPEGGIGGQCLEGVGQLDLAAAARFGL